MGVGVGADEFGGAGPVLQLGRLTGCRVAGKVSPVTACPAGALGAGATLLVQSAWS
jgi:hypothetical protein